MAASGGYALELPKRLRNQQQDSESDPRTSVIGYFRTQPKGSLDLREWEPELVKQYFADPTNIVLVIQAERKTVRAFGWTENSSRPFHSKISRSKRPVHSRSADRITASRLNVFFAPKAHATWTLVHLHQ